jgi:hypothetical protein
MLGFGVLGLLPLVIPSKILVSGFVASTLAISIPIGIAQWIALRQILYTSVLWVFTVPVGFFINVLLIKYFPLLIKYVPDSIWLRADDESIAVFTIGYLIGGFVIGLPQWLVLRRQLSRASFWLLGSSIGTAGGLWFILITDLINQNGVIAFILGVLIYAVMTGLTLAGLVAYNEQF